MKNSAEAVYVFIWDTAVVILVKFTIRKAENECLQKSNDAQT
jgi:hypothetical protein